MWNKSKRKYESFTGRASHSADTFRQNIKGLEWTWAEPDSPKTYLKCPAGRLGDTAKYQNYFRDLTLEPGLIFGSCIVIFGVSCFFVKLYTRWRELFTLFTSVWYLPQQQTVLLGKWDVLHQSLVDELTLSNLDSILKSLEHYFI